MIKLEDYQNAYKHIRFERRDGILQVRLHKNDGPAVWGAGLEDLHAEVGNAFFHVARDPDNEIVIVTGTGDEFITKVDQSAVDINTAFLDRGFKEGRDIFNNLLDIDVPVIGAVNGPATVHSELVLLSDIVIASERACFTDLHAPNGIVPGDGVHVFWEMLLGPNRSRHYLLTGHVINAQEGRELGMVAEVVPHEQTLNRAWQVARDLLAKPRLMRRYSRVALTQNIKRRLLDDLGYGMQLESLAMLSMMGK